MKLSFQQAIICMKRVPNKRVVPILLRRCNLSKVISDVQLSMFLSYLLVQVFKIDDSWCVGNIDFFLKPCRWLMTLIAIDKELMGTLCHAYKTNQMHILPLGWWSGVEIIGNKPNISLRS
jgi:hypothetical protein